MLPDKSPATTNAQVSGYLRRATTLSAEDLPKLQKEQQPSQLMTEPSGLNTSAGRGTTRLRSRSLLTVDTSAPSGSTPVEGMPDTTHADDGQVLSSPVVDQLPPDSALSATSEQSLLQIPARDSHYRSS